MRQAAVILVLAACGPSGGTPDARNGNHPDAHVTVDAIAEADAANPPDAALDAGTLPYRHTLTIDGANDFAAGDTFATTSAGYTAFVTWDATTLYLGYQGPDLDPTAPNTDSKWVFAYVDVDPGAATGEAHSLIYNTQRATFPTGFGAEYYVRWKCDGTFATIESGDGSGTWTTIAATVTSGRAGDFLELAVPLDTVGNPAVLGVETWMINEQATVEGTYAGLYATNFTDGYYPDLALTSYLRADFASANAPNDPANRRP
jgi:hypothetical protein